jgi:uncharacterized YigZ family protein
MITDFQTIKAPSDSFFKEKGSKFYSFAFPVKSEEEVKSCLKSLKEEFKDAGHHCYGFKLGVKGDKYRYSDDGEPNNTAGKPIYGQLNSFEVTNVLVVVIRYFGGTKLGVGGLIQAYKEGAKLALENASVITEEVVEQITIYFKYEEMNVMMSIVKILDLKIIQQQFELDCLITLEFPIKKKEALLLKLLDYPKLEIID